MEEKQQEKEKVVITPGQSVILGAFALVVIFLFAFGCYGCSYQPIISVPDEGEAAGVLSRLIDTQWALDDTEGVVVLDELGSALLTLSFIDAPSEEYALTVNYTLQGQPPKVGALSWDGEDGFTLTVGRKANILKIVYSRSRDGKTETLTVRGSESNRQCYYLKV